MTPRFIELRNSLPLQVAIAIVKAAMLLIRAMISLFVQLPQSVLKRCSTCLVISPAQLGNKRRFGCWAGNPPSWEASPLELRAPVPALFATFYPLNTNNFVLRQDASRRGLRQKAEKSEDDL
jgi:hypothetical protein